MGKYICIKGFKLPYFDENMCRTEQYGEIAKDSIWEISKDISESDIRLNKVGGFAEFDYIDITKEEFNSNFVLQN